MGTYRLRRCSIVASPSSARTIHLGRCMAASIKTFGGQMSQTAKDFLQSRDSWLEMKMMPGAHGGFDIVLRIDGAYFSKADAINMLDHWRERLQEICETEGI